MIEALGWISTVLVLIGYTLNAKGKFQYAMVAWIVGDVGWITYDFYISNFSHLALSSIIIVLNLYGIWNIKRMKNGGVK